MFVPALWRVAGGSLAAALVVVSFAAGCSSHRPEKNPYLVEKFEEIDETLSDLKTLQRDINILQDDLAFFNDEIKQIKAMKGGLTPKEREQIAAATAKIAEFEKLTANLDRVKADLVAVES